MTLRASRNAISSQGAGSGPLQLDWLDGLTKNHSGPAPAPASPSRRRGKVEELMIQGICGRTFIASSVPDGPLSLWESRLRERLAMVGSTECALIWREKVSPAGQSISRLAVSTRHTNGTGSTGSQWTTPAASESGNRKEKYAQGGTPLTMQMCQASPWVTPSARDWKDSAGMATEAGDRTRVDQLPRQMAVNAYHPTPLSLSFKDSHQPGTNRTIEQMRAYMPTPTVADVQGGQESEKRHSIIRASSERHLLRNGTYWSDAEWIVCHDDKARRAQSGLRFLVDGLPGRVDLWRVGGNAIVPEAAKEVIAAVIDVYGLPSGWGVAA